MDSKRLSASRRTELAQALEACADIGVGIASVEEIDRLNILQATLLAMRRAVAKLPKPPRHILVDGNRLPLWSFPATAVVRGDTSCMCIAAASIIAKTKRDAMMDEAHRRYPGYGWATNRGYGTASHLEALHRLGPTPLHRLSFAPVRAAKARVPKG